MAFYFGRGLAAFGESVARTAGAMSLEAMRADLEMERTKLANEMALQRESVGRKESHASAKELQDARIAAEGPERDARIGLTKTQTVASETNTNIAKANEERTRKGIEAARGGGQFDAYLDRTAHWETGAKGGRPNELGSGADGKFQFMPDTWADLRKKEPDLNLPEKVNQATPEQERKAAERYTQRSAEALQKAGLDVTPANLYLAHRFGAEGAKTVLSAEDGKRISDLFPPIYTQQNPDMAGKTTGDFKRFAEERYKGVTLGGGGTSATDRTRAALVESGQLDKVAELDFRREQEQAKRDAPPDGAKLAEWWRKATPEQRQAMSDVLDMQRERRATPSELVGYEPDPNKPGALRPIAGGPRDPDQIGRTEAAKEGAKLKSANDEQNKAAGFADRMTASNGILANLDKQGANTWQRVFEAAGGVGNFAKSEDYQKFEQARRDFINAVLRRESGAVISDAEFANADRQYFPRPGDTVEVIAQKAKNREVALNGMIRSAGPTYKPPQIDAGQQGNKPGLPTVGEVMEGYRFKGGNPADRNSWEPVR